MAQSVMRGAAGSRSRQLLTTLILIAALGVFPGWRVMGQETSLRPEDIKALYLYNFAKFVQWPDQAFKDAGMPFRIEILGRDPFDGRLDVLLIGKSVQGRRIEVVHSFGEASLKPVHLAFVSGSQIKRLDAVLTGYRRGAVLTVSDIQGFTERGGMIGFITEGSTVRFRINQDAVTLSLLQMRSQLLVMGVQPRLGADPRDRP